ncbi:class I SAM-dependent methyltransferase [Micromonospora purpureochromogenes]|uniref:SAM-dependent methyltransferase n=1 Tax=Micromonospora purpureochromogenes TaxID=47872 RepID=A0ABX2RSX3_9ACTN|nr:class I SAM-dependent methyltransferase [Micromonospora purpureochromogenes]NYF59645.1 SAM-dependent methyltransferase [Micromonospora purpureochromogenes]
MIDYNLEADRYDESRGGEARAAAAAAAVDQLLPPSARLLLDVACGTGVVSARLRRPGRTIVGVDRSAGMIAKAAGRLPGDVLLGDAAALPVRSGWGDGVLMIWLLHLVPNSEQMIAEAARVLGPTGLLLTTVDKNEAPFTVASDVAELTGSLRCRYAGERADGHGRVIAAADRHGLRQVAETTFAGVGQGRTPRQWIGRIRGEVIPWVGKDESDELCSALAALPDQHTPRPDPVYRLVALAR